ncbi:hypothetical protein Glove_31g25 [Diversispora epigaea]|uniref:Elongation factor Ts, mitochondrial n=1 Tax=Diversispora epigaea TaxID=1348612 RepID=A0A397JHA2_9GLOM|nr:hypothetical protein Glove_31g25 [Diversispora epigaea]
MSQKRFFSIIDTIFNTYNTTIFHPKLLFPQQLKCKLSFSFSPKYYNTNTTTSTSTPLSSSTQIKPNLKLLSQLRQETQVGIIKAREALIKHNNDYDKAVSWLLKDSRINGLEKAEKLKSRVAKEGLIGVVVTKFDEMIGKNGERKLSGNKGAIVEINCETDFVSRNNLFQKFVTQIASTSLLLSSEILIPNVIPKSIIQSISPQSISSFPLLPHPSLDFTSSSSTTTTTIPSLDSPPTLNESLLELIGKLGENINLSRIEIFNNNNNNHSSSNDSNNNDDDKILVTGGYVHGGINNDQYTGKIGALVVIEIQQQKIIYSQKIIDKINKLSRDLARQIVGFNPKRIHKDSKDDNNNNIEDDDDNEILMNQEFIIGGGVNGETVEQVLKNYEKDFNLKINILEFKRWECGKL